MSTAAAAEDRESDLQRVEVPDAGIAVAFPPDWDVDVEMRYVESEDGNEKLAYWDVLSAITEDGTTCTIKHYPHSTVSPADLAQSSVTYLTGIGPDVIAEAVPVWLAVGEAHRVYAQIPDSYLESPKHGFSSQYLIDRRFDDGLLELHCISPERDARDWMGIAETLEWLPGGAVPPTAESGAGEVQRIELPDAGVAVSFAIDFGTDLEPVPYEMGLPPDAMETTPVTTFIVAWEDDGVDCGLEVFEGNPLTLEEHAAWIEQSGREQPDFEGTVTHASVSLPMGDAVRIDGDHQGHGVWTTIYLVDHGDTRYQLYCRDDQRAADDYLSIAETIELLDGEPADELPPGVPDDAVSWGVVEGYASQLPVSEAQEGAWLMRVWCDRALWIEYADGTYEERIACMLTDDPVEPPEAQGVPPTETLVLSGGACEWVSEYWYLTDESEVWASGWALMVHPDGEVLGSSQYDAEAVDCSGE
jgi:hypothetical protein